MKLNVISILRLLAMMAAMSMIIAGCGGAGGTIGGGGGGGTSFTAAFSFSGFGGVSIAPIGASSSPQDVQVRVNGVVRTVQDAIVPEDLLAGGRVSVLNKGTRLLNATVNDPSIGLIFGSSTVHPPVSADGVLLADVITMDGVLFRTPPLTWQGGSLPNGLTVLFNAFEDEGDVSGSVNVTITMPAGQGTATGSTVFTYSSPRNFNDVRFAMETADSSRVEINDTGHISGTAAVNGAVSVPWRSFRASQNSTLNAWTTAGIIIGFRN